MHYLGFVHRNLKWSNIIYNSENDEFCLIDFEDASKENEFIRFEKRIYPTDINKLRIAYTRRIDLYLVGNMIYRLYKYMNFELPNQLTSLADDLLDLYQYQDYDADKLINDLSKIYLD